MDYSGWEVLEEISFHMKVLFVYLFPFLFRLTTFFRGILLFSVLNDRNWSSLLRCITNVSIYSLTLIFTSTANSKTLTISLTFPKTLINSARRIATIILHTAIVNFVILKHKRLKENGKKYNLHWSFSFAITSYALQ